MEREICFILDAGNLGRGGGVVGLLGPSRGQLLPINTQWVRAFIDRAGERGLCAERAPTALSIILKLVTCGLPGVVLIKYWPFSVPGSVCPLCFEASSQNCGSSGHGDSLVLVLLTSSTWWGLQYL